MLKKNIITRIPWPVWFIFVIIMINLVQFPIIREAAGERWGALYRVDDDNIFYEYENASDPETPTRFRIFTILGRVAPNTTLITSEDELFGAGSNSRFKAMSLGRVNEICFVKDDHMPSLNSFDRSAHLASKGEGWLTVPHRKSGSPPIQWEIHIKDSPPTEIYFYELVHREEWLFIDVSLFNQQKGCR